jgi:hypothetical protein
MKDMVALRNGPVLVNVHTRDRCAGQHCCIHNPSDHHMLTWQPRWDSTEKRMWRECDHGHTHPDPDDLAFLRKAFGYERAAMYAIHGCDGCCQPYVKELEGGTDGGN